MHRLPAGPAILLTVIVTATAGFGADIRNAGTCDTIVYSANPLYPPYHWAVGEQALEGASVELLRMVAPPGVRLQSVTLPWKRTLALAAEGEIDLVLSLRITPERSAFLNFAPHRSFPNPIVVFVRSDHRFPYREWKDLKGKRGGISLGDTFGAGFDEYWRKELTIEDAPSMVENFRKLHEGRIDYFITSRYVGEAYLSSQKFSTPIMSLSPPISDMNIHFGFSKKSACGKYLDQINSRLEALDKQGATEKLLKKYLLKFKKDSKQKTDSN